MVYAFGALQFEWTKPSQPPTGYLLSILCMVVPSGEVYMEEDHRIHRGQIHSVVRSIQASSRCEAIFFAVYNPASIDHGIAYTLLIQPASKYLKY